MTTPSGDLDDLRAATSSPRIRRRGSRLRIVERELEPAVRALRTLRVRDGGLDLLHRAA